MPYPKKNLNANESIALDMHPHWWYFSEPVFALIASIAFTVVVLTTTDSGSDSRKYLGYVGIALIVLTALWLLWRYLSWITTNFVITSHRLIFRKGVIGKSGVEIPLERVNNVNFNQTVFERLLGAGDLLIESGGEDGQQRFTDVRHPDRVQNLIHAAVEQAQQRRAEQRTPGTTQAAHVDVAGQLERLEGMLERGTLTPDEFEAQKRRLLDG